jgi:hypothetical protein
MKPRQRPSGAITAISRITGQMVSDGISTRSRDHRIACTPFQKHDRLASLHENLAYPQVTEDNSPVDSMQVVYLQTQNQNPAYRLAPQSAHELAKRTLIDLNRRNVPNPYPNSSKTPPNDPNSTE